MFHKIKQVYHSKQCGVRLIGGKLPGGRSHESDHLKPSNVLYFRGDYGTNLIGCPRENKAVRVPYPYDPVHWYGKCGR